MRKSNMLVRLALFNEHKRTSLRRDEITKKGWEAIKYFHLHVSTYWFSVFNGKTRDFRGVFASAQETLRKVFGMELVELMSRAEMEKDQNGTAEARDGESAIGLKKKSMWSLVHASLVLDTDESLDAAPAAGSKAYILRSVLDADIIEMAARTDEQLLDDELCQFPLQEDPDPEEGITCYGSIINWSAADQLGAIGILYVVLALIMVSGGVLSDCELQHAFSALHQLSAA